MTLWVYCHDWSDNSATYPLRSAPPKLPEHVTKRAA